MNRSEILGTAKSHVTKDRNATHGEPEKSFGAIAAIWSARLGIVITPSQACIMLVDLKTCRAWSNPAHADNWIDMCGYGACGGELGTAEAKAAPVAVNWAPPKPVENWNNALD